LEFSRWVEAQIAAEDIEALWDYRQRAPHAQRAHPSEDHLLPLFTALGAAGASAQVEAFYRGISDYVIAMDGYAFH
jgi:4,5-DOPA dioxygenase extradiol